MPPPIQPTGGGAAIIPTGPEHLRNRDTHYPYRFDSYFYYLSAFRVPEAVLVLVAGDEQKSILFCRDKDVEREIWDGYRHGPDGARETFAFDEAYSIGRFDEMLPDLLANQPTLFHSMGHDEAFDARILAASTACARIPARASMRRRRYATCARWSTKCA